MQLVKAAKLKTLTEFLGGQNHVASAVVPKDDDSTAILMLKSQIPASANSLSLTYKDLRGDQSSNIIQDDSGNDLASLRNFSVEII